MSLKMSNESISELSETDEDVNENNSSISEMVFIPDLDQETFKPLVSYDSSDNYDSDHDPDLAVSENFQTDLLKLDTSKAQRKSEKSKILRSECKPYPTKTGLKSAKSPKPIDCSRCRFKCSQNFSEEDRFLLCKNYWGLKDYKLQKEYIIQHVKIEKTKRPKKGAKKHHGSAKKYYLKNTKGNFRVCAQYFEKTLCISNGPINTALAYKNETGTFLGLDKRGRKTPGNATSEEQVEYVKQHIESFHLQYLDPKPTVVKMYELYLDFCKEKSIHPVKCPIYRKILCTYSL